jgi:hypothetical protein
VRARNRDACPGSDTKVLIMYTKELTMKEIGGFMGVNESRVSQIHKCPPRENASGTAIERNSVQRRLLGLPRTQVIA